MVFTEMARSRDLPIYKAGYQLLKLTTSAVSQFTRELRPTLGQQLHSEAAGLVLSVYRANAAVDKRPHLASLLESLYSPLRSGVSTWRMIQWRDAAVQTATSGCYGNAAHTASGRAYAAR